MPPDQRDGATGALDGHARAHGSSGILLAKRPAGATQSTSYDQLRAVAKDSDQALYRRAFVLTRNPTDAKDLVQRTLERGLRCLHQFQPGTNIRVWLLRIMVNLFLDDCRRRTRGPRVESLDEAAHTVATAEPDGEPIWANITPEQVQTALSTIAPLFREIYQLRVRDGLSYQDIALRMQIPVGTVSTRLARAREKLQRALRDATVVPVAEECP